MAEEPQPPSVVEGATEGTDPLPAASKAEAAAMSSLDTKTDEAAAPKKEVDMKALNDAMAKLGGMGAAEGKAAVPTATKKEEEPKKLVKVDQADVGVVVSWLVKIRMERGRLIDV